VNHLILASEQRRSCILLCCLILLPVVLAFAGEAYIQPTITGYLEEMDDGTPSYARFTGGMRCGLFSNPPALGTDHAFLKFSLDTLPDSCVITNASIAYYQFEHTGGLPVVDIRLIRDPTAQPPHDAFFGIKNGRVIASAEPSPDGLTAWQLDSTANPLLDSCHRVGVASFGIHWSGPPQDTFRASAYGYDSSSAPYLHVVYTPAGINEAQNVPVQMTAFAITPNPTSRALWVTGLPATPSRLTLRSALGETVRSHALPQSGKTQLDLRGLPPGVYMATLQAGPQSLIRKLVLTAH
jgi:hypothetical protein